MENTILATPCGLFCGDCEFLGNLCRGCEQVQGKPFWTAQFKFEFCPLYDCCFNQKQLEHCGMCNDFPCNTFNLLRDPSLSDEEAAKALQKRKSDLMRRKEIGTEAWLDERK
jgi:hypothetical protein